MVIKRERTISSNWASERTSYFLKNEKLDRFCKYYKNELWMSIIEYFSEIFRHLNSLNSNMQGWKVHTDIHHKHYIENNLVCNVSVS